MNLNIFQQPRKVFIILFSFFFLFSLWIYAIPLFSNYQKPAKESKSIANGRLVWQKYNCHTCHQLYGLGGYLGPDLTNVYSRRQQNEDYLKAIIHSGVRQMPSFKMSEAEMTSLLAFLKNLDGTGNADVAKYQPQLIGTFTLKE